MAFEKFCAMAVWILLCSGGPISMLRSPIDIMKLTLVLTTLSLLTQFNMLKCHYKLAVERAHTVIAPQSIQNSNCNVLTDQTLFVCVCKITIWMILLMRGKNRNQTLQIKIFLAKRNKDFRGKHWKNPFLPDGFDQEKRLHLITLGGVPSQKKKKNNIRIVLYAQTFQLCKFNNDTHGLMANKLFRSAHNYLV